MWDKWVKNAHGVEGVEESTGAHYMGMVDGRYRTNAPVFVPRCCVECAHYDAGESGDYGSKLSPPSCLKNVFLPTRKGTCKWQERWGL